MEEGTTDPNASGAPSIEDLAPLFPAYEFEQFIAEGGMGAVYLARQISLDRPVAIKILARELGEDPVFRASFEAEAKAMARLNHPNLIGVFDFGEAGGMLFIVMEMVHGKSLHDSAYGRTIDPVQAAGIVSAISRGLEHAHKAGILHRDIKPGNILLDADGSPKIGDFGLAQPMGQKTGEDEMIYGTPGYTAPEVYQRKGDQRSDIYSVGILLHELLTGKLPDGSGTPPSLLCGCSRAFDSIVARATNPNPLVRYATAGELADDLDKAAKAVDAANASTNRLVLPSALPKGAAGPRRALPSSSSRAQAQAQVLAQKQRNQSSPVIAIVAICAVLGIGLIAMLASGGAKNKSRGGTGAAAPSKNVAETGSGRSEQAGGGGRTQEGAGEAAELTGNRPPAPPVTPGGGEPVDKTAKPSPGEALARLRDKLAAGARDEFPPGTEARDGSHFVLVDQAMGWWQAKEFAEACGAHLAVLPRASDRRWFREKFPSDDPVWIGAGKASVEQWQWLDGSKWDDDGGRPTADLSRRSLTIGSSGGLQAEPSAERFHFALQWRDDASNPATTGAQLKRTADSIKTRGVEHAIYPVGTRSYTPLQSHFFIVPKATSWEDARKLAIAAGGYLAVPSSKAESEWIREAFAAESSPGTALWLGGFRLKPEEPWRWLTGEAWNHPSGWLGGMAPGGNAAGRLMLRLGGDGAGWVANDGADGGALGLLIEWSPPRKAATIASFDLDTWLAKTDEAFLARVQADIDGYKKDHELLIDRYVRTIERLGRKHTSALSGQEGREKDRIREAIQDAVREVEKSGKLLAEVPKSAPDDFHDLQKKTKNSEVELIEEFQKKLSNQVGTYTLGLTKQAGQLTSDGYTEAATALNSRLGLIDGKGAAFLELLGLDDPSATAPADAEEQEKKDGAAE